MCRHPILSTRPGEIEQKKFLRPIVSFSKGRKALSDSLKSFGAQFNKTSEQVDAALEIAERTLKAFRSTLVKRGQEILEKFADQQRALVIVSRAQQWLRSLALTWDYLTLRDPAC